jgi:peroxiredoxin
VGGVSGDRNPYVLPRDLPVPVDDGAADHLVGEAIPALSLASTSDVAIDLSVAAQRTLVLYLYPRTGRPGEPLPKGWDDIPGARGCTPQSCAFRDHFAELQSLGADVLGLSAQPLADQVEFANRVELPYPILSDPELELAQALRLPTFDVAGMRLYRRLTLIAREGRIEKVFYPVFPPDRNAADVAAWLTESDSA